MAQLALYGLECSKDTRDELTRKLELVPRVDEDKSLALVDSPPASPPSHFCQIVSAAQLERYKGLGLYLNLRALFFFFSSSFVGEGYKTQPSFYEEIPVWLLP